MQVGRFFALGLVAAAMLAGKPVSIAAQGGGLPAEPTYADLVDLADAAEIVVHAKVRKQAVLPPERAPGLLPGHARLYVQARTQSLISGSIPVGESLAYLVDVPLDSRGRPPKLKKQEFLLFARPVSARPGEIQLVERSSQLPWGEQTEARLRPILSDLLAADAPPRVTGVRDALAVAGNLAGESETQVFLATDNGDPVSITIVRRPGQQPVWGVSWTDIVDQAARPPQPGTVRWYRLACFLPPSLPGGTNLSRDSETRALAARDYRFVIEQLGPCPRVLGDNLR